jgi:hypothetical protein
MDRNCNALLFLLTLPSLKHMRCIAFFLVRHIHKYEDCNFNFNIHGFPETFFSNHNFEVRASMHQVGIFNEILASFHVLRCILCLIALCARVSLNFF